MILGGNQSVKGIVVSVLEFASFNVLESGGHSLFVDFSKVLVVFHFYLTLKF
jgi:hypothetical protein